MSEERPRRAGQGILPYKTPAAVRQRGAILRRVSVAKGYIQLRLFPFRTNSGRTAASAVLQNTA
ncbi:MAG: hypothetical protein K6E38_06680, partial [Fretibacterium sp.]|nr:hypothetical protein [Fretibacterium sp.]